MNNHRRRRSSRLLVAALLAIVLVAGVVGVTAIVLGEFARALGQAFAGIAAGILTFTLLLHLCAYGIALLSRLPFLTWPQVLLLILENWPALARGWQSWIGP